MDNSMAQLGGGGGAGFFRLGISARENVRGPAGHLHGLITLTTNARSQLSSNSTPPAPAAFAQRMRAYCVVWPRAGIHRCSASRSPLSA